MIGLAGLASATEHERRNEHRGVKSAITSGKQEIIIMRIVHGYAKSKSRINACAQASLAKFAQIANAAGHLN